MADAAPSPLTERTFLDVLREHRRGGLVTELDEGLAEVLSAVEDTDKQGTITITIKIIPDRSGAVVVEDTLKVNPPERKKPTSLFFRRGDTLVREDPNQFVLPGMPGAEDGPIAVDGGELIDGADVATGEIIDIHARKETSA